MKLKKGNKNGMSKVNQFSKSHEYIFHNPWNNAFWRFLKMATANVIWMHRHAHARLLYTEFYSRVDDKIYCTQAHASQLVVEYLK